MHTNTAMDIKLNQAAGQQVTAVGFQPEALWPSFFGCFSATDDVVAGIACLYVDTAYGALASTAVAPTAFGTAAPWMGLIA